MYSCKTAKAKYLKQFGIIVSISLLIPLVHLFHVKRQSIAISAHFVTLFTSDSTFEMADSVLLHCIVTVAFKVTLTTSPFTLVPHLGLNLRKIKSFMQPFSTKSYT